MAQKRPAKPAEPNAGAAVRLEPRTSQVLRWDPEKLVLARMRAASGDFSLFADLCEAMMPDDRISQALEKLYAATTLPLTFKLPGQDSEKSKDDPVVQALDSDFWKMLPEESLRSITAWIGLANCALVHVDGWTVDPETGRALPTISVWSLRHLRHDAQLGWVVRTARATGDYFGAEEQVTPGDGNWLILLAGSSWRAIAQARGHGVAMFWLLKQYAIVDWASSSERHGQGTNIAFCENPQTAPKLENPGRVQLARDMATMARNGNLVMPPGWKHKIASDTADNYKTFQEQIRAADSGATIGIIGTNLTTEVKEGSRAAASVQESVDAGRMRGLLNFLSTGLRTQLLAWWTAFNFGPAAITPYPEWDTTPPADRKADAEARKLDSEAFKNYVDAGLRPSRKAWAERAGVVLGEGDDAVLPSARPATPTPLQPDAAARARVQAKAQATPTDAFSRGLDYAGRLEETTRKHAAKELAPTLASVLASVERSESYEEAKQAILEAYQDRAPASQLCRLTEAMMIMAELAGVEAVRQEVLEDQDDDTEAE